jgi:hypothetical protein
MLGRKANHRDHKAPGADNTEVGLVSLVRGGIVERYLSEMTGFDPHARKRYSPYRLGVPRGG